MIRKTVGLALVLAAALPATAPAAVAPQPPLDISKMPYKPVGHFKAADTLPSPDTGCESVMQPLRKGEIFNPSGDWNSFDTNVFEVMCLPFRAPGDTSDKDPMGNGGAAQHGFCGGSDPDAYGNLAQIAGACPNNQLEWSRYYAATMKEILKDFGVTIRQYRFDVPDPGLTGNTRFGQGINTAAIVPGADNPDETVVIGAHYDKTNDGPASAWDSQEGHAEMIRMAKLMADYWHATGTRPSATLKFIPWEAEESGTYGSQDYTNNNIVPGEEYKVRGYWNTDPCAGGYPSYQYGNPALRQQMGIQLADPGAIGGVSASDATRITQFNKRAPELVEQVLDHLDDTVTTLAGEMPAFVSKTEGTSDLGKDGGIKLGSARPVLFSSDWRNFEVLGIPFFNPGPEVTGPQQETDGSITYDPLTYSADALTTFHTPNDNLATMMRYTGGGLDGTHYSESWAKGMEFCSHLLSWGMLQHDQVGAQTTNGDVVAYYEALPNEAKEDQDVSFDADGSYEYLDAKTRAYVGEGQLTYSWDFGDGTSGTGKQVKHAYASVGKYPSKLTVRNTKTGKTATMSVPITVIPNDLAGPVLTKPAPQDDDGTFDIAFDYKGEQASALQEISVEESSNATQPLQETGDALDRWTVTKPTDAAISEWQLSDSSTAKVRGNLSASKSKSFWTGISSSSENFQGPSAGDSILTLKDDITLARGGTVSLSYQSSFVNAAKDSGLVQIAVDDGSTSSLEWVTVDQFTNGTNDEDSVSQPEYVQGDQGDLTFKPRFADITKFAGRKVKVRFIYRLGAQDDPPLASARTGWYVDDIRIVSGSYKEIGRTKARTFTVSGKTKGAYAYRVKAVFAQGVKSSASNSEAVEVTRGVPVKASSCATAAGFTKLAVTPAGRALKLSLGLSGKPAVVELFKQSTGGRALRARRVQRLTTSKASAVLKAAAKLPAGVYYLRLTTPSAAGVKDTRYVALRLRGGRFSKLKQFQRASSCGLLSRFALSAPTFDARKALKITLASTQPASASVVVYRGKKVVKRFKAVKLATGRAQSLTLSGRRLARGAYRVSVTTTKGKEKVKASLYATRL